jgi:hypothetical protein
MFRVAAQGELINCEGPQEELQGWQLVFWSLPQGVCSKVTPSWQVEQLRHCVSLEAVHACCWYSKARHTRHPAHCVFVSSVHVDNTARPTHPVQLAHDWSLFALGAMFW